MGYSVRDKGFYGPMCGCTSLCCLGWSMLERAGIPIHKEFLDKTMVEMDMAFKEGGYPYGWSNEACQKASVFSEEKVRKELTSLKKPIHARSDQAGGCLPMGAMTLVHQLRPWKDYSAELVRNHVIALARARGAIVNGHGSGYIHGCYGLLAAATVGDGIGKDDPFRIIMDYYKPYINLARCCNGSFYTQPTRDDMNGDYGRSTRNLPTAVWALVLSVPKRALLVQGRKDYKGKMDTAYRALLKRDFAAAARALQNPAAEDAPVASALLETLAREVQLEIAALEALEKAGDIGELQARLSRAKSQFGALENFKEKVGHFEEGLQQEPWKLELKLAANYRQLVDALKRNKTAAYAGDLQRFGEKYLDSLYGRWAVEVAKEYLASGTIKNPSVAIVTTVEANGATPPATPAVAGGGTAPSSAADSGAPAVATTPKPSTRMDLSPEALAAWQARFVKKLDALAKGGVKLKVDLGDKRDYVLRGANEVSLLVNTQGNDLPMPWRLLSPGYRAALAKSAATDNDVEALLIAAVMHMACHQKEQAEDLFAKAALKDANTVKTAKAELGDRKGSP